MGQAVRGQHPAVVARSQLNRLRPGKSRLAPLLVIAVVCGAPAGCGEEGTTTTRRDTLRTIAGGGEQLGDRGRATGAGLCGPNDVARDQAGNIYISDGGAYCSGPGGNTVRKIDGDGVITTIAGTGKPGFSGDGGPATSARLNLPIAVATDGKGNVYISDEENCRVRKVNRRGVIATIAGTGRAGHSGDGGPATSARLTDPGGLALDERGNLYLADYVAIRRIDPAGRITTVAGTGKAGFSGDGGPATEAQLTAYDVAVDREGKIYISDTDHDRVRMVDRDGIITTVAGSGRAASKLGNGVPPPAQP
jgi:hypothetical protein